jgi:RNA polymerase sigma factor (sigma-70 family)
VFGRWRTIRGNPEGYLRRTFYHLAADRWRRKQAWRARLSLLGRPGAQPDDTGAVDNRDQLLRLLRQLPPRQRTAIMLRYWEELTEAQAAQAMGCSPGTVKSVTSRGMRRLREPGGLGENDGTPQPTGRTS